MSAILGPLILRVHAPRDLHWSATDAGIKATRELSVGNVPGPTRGQGDAKETMGETGGDLGQDHQTEARKIHGAGRGTRVKTPDQGSAKTAKKETKEEIGSRTRKMEGKRE